jgi:hypothetical protein
VYTADLITGSTTKNENAEEVDGRREKCSTGVVVTGLLVRLEAA